MVMKQPVEPKLPLEYPVQPNPPPRPKRDDEAVIRRAAESVLDDVMQHLEGNESERESYLGDLIAAFTDLPNDGFEAAIYLQDHFHYEADMDLCEILDGAARFGKLDEMIREWVEANQIRPQFAIGDAVLVPMVVKVLEQKPGDIERYVGRRQLIPGIVTGIYADRAQYVVKTAENKREGSGFLIDYESTQADPNADPAERPASERAGSPDPAAAAGILPDGAEPAIDVLPEQPDRGGEAEGRSGWLIAMSNWGFLAAFLAALLSLIAAAFVVGAKIDSDIKAIMEEAKRPR